MIRILLPIIILIALFYFFKSDLTRFTKEVDKNASISVGLNQISSSESVYQPRTGTNFKNEILELEFDLEALLGSKEFYDFSIGFTSRRSMDDFLLNLKDSGLTLLSSIPQLSSSRFRVTDPRLAAKFLSENDSIKQFEINFPIFRPRVPLMSEESEGNPEYRTVGESLHLAEDRTNWGMEVKIAVLDSGIDFSHPALSHLQHEQISLIDPSVSQSVSLSHGTGIASIIAGMNEDYLGIAPKAKILSLQVLDENGVGDVFTLAEGIVLAVDKGCSVINLSLGGQESSEILKAAVNYAESKGVILVAAAGNDGFSEVSFPARYDSVIGVTALSPDGRVADFSNFGDGVDLAAPGVGIVSAWNDNGYAIFDGTSSAAALVTGAIATEISRNPKMEKKNLQKLFLELANEVDQPGFDENSGYGALNLNRVIHRNDLTYHDGAVVGYYFHPENLINLGDGGTVPFTITVQNQGSSWINGMNLIVEYRGLEKNYFFSNLQPGQTRSEKLFVEVGQGREGFEIRSSIELLGQDDKNPANNLRVSKLKLPTVK